MGTGLENVWHEVCREAVCMVNQGAERRRSRAVECPHPNGYIGTSSTTFETVTLERILEGGNMKRALRSVCAMFRTSCCSSLRSQVPEEYSGLSAIRLVSDATVSFCLVIIAFIKVNGA